MKKSTEKRILSHIGRMTEMLEELDRIRESGRRGEAKRLAILSKAGLLDAA